MQRRACAPRASNLRLLVAQLALVGDKTSKVIAMIAGMGSGKTGGAAAKALIGTLQNNGAPTLVIEPVYSMFASVFLPEFARVCEEAGVRWKFNKQDKIITIFDGPRKLQIFCRSAERPELIIGFNVGLVIIDEAANVPEAIFHRAVQRARDRRAPVVQVVIVTTPEGFNWVHTLCTQTENPITVIRAKTYDNPFLSKDYIENMTRFMSEEDKRAYLHGEFVAKTGNVYKQFSRERNLRPCLNPFAGDLFVGADFNVKQMSWVVGRRIGDELHIWGEVIAPGNTITHINALKAYLLEQARKRGVRSSLAEIVARTTIVPDASSKAEKTSAAASDVHHLIQAGFNVELAGMNPFIRDRVFSVNAAFVDGLLLIDPQGAPMTVKAIEAQGYNKYGVPEKKDGIDDVCDAVGYAVHRYLPSVAPRTQQHWKQAAKADELQHKIERGWQ